MKIDSKLGLSLVSGCLLGILVGVSAYASDKMHLVTYLGSDGSTSFEMNRPQIFNAEKIARDALAKLNVSLKVTQLPAMRALQQADAGYVDGDLWRLEGTDQHYANLIAIAEPICFADIYLYTLLDRTQSNYWETMASPRVILLPETRKLIHQLPKSLTRNEPIQSLSVSQALRALLRGDGNIILLPEGLIEVIEKEQQGSLPWVLKLHPKVAQLPAHLLMHRRHSGIAEQLSAHIAESKRNFNNEHHDLRSHPISCR